MEYRAETNYKCFEDLNNALRDFAKSTGKHLCQSPFLIKFIKTDFIKKVTRA